MKPARARGFTLIEVMIAVVIIGILAAVAYPSYQDYIRKGNRAAAQSFMMTIAQRQEQYLLSNRSYADDAEDPTNPATCTCSPSPCSCPSKLNLMWPPETLGKYTFAVTYTGGSKATYEITATPVGQQAVAGKFDQLKLTSAGTKTPTAEWTR